VTTVTATGDAPLRSRVPSIVAPESAVESVAHDVLVTAPVLAPQEHGLIGASAAAAVGRNPGSSTPVMVQSILAIAFAEAIVFYVLFRVK
jgi:F-type H+-transporting ATPase subunit c